MVVVMVPPTSRPTPLRTRTGSSLPTPSPLLDAVGVKSAAVASMSGGACAALILAAGSPERVAAAVFIAPGLSLTPPYPERAAAGAVFDGTPTRLRWLAQVQPALPWLEDWKGFLEFFSARCFSEPDSEDQIRLWVEMGLETSPEVILATVDADGPDGDEERRLIAALTTPVLVIHGTDDQVIPLARSEEFARLREVGSQLFRDQGTNRNSAIPTR